MASSDGGRSWRETCANGDFATGKKQATCPWVGYANSLVATSDGTLLMGLARGGVFTSIDGGAVWHLTLNISGGDPVDVASAGADAWAVSTSSLSLFASVNGGRSWVGLSFHPKTVS